MVTVARAVEKILEDKPFMQEALAKGIINYAALAEDMTPQIQKELGKEAQHAAVMMALRRASEKLETRFQETKNLQKLKDITIMSNLFIMTVTKTPSTVEAVRGMHKHVDPGEDLLTITEGLHEISIISNAKYLGRIRQEFEKQNKRQIKKIITEVASLTVSIPKEYLDVSGFYFLILRALAWDNINIVEAVSTYSELTLIFSEEEVTKAYKALRK